MFTVFMGHSGFIMPECTHVYEKKRMCKMPFPVVFRFITLFHRNKRKMVMQGPGTTDDYSSPGYKTWMTNGTRLRYVL